MKSILCGVLVAICLSSASATASGADDGGFSYAGEECHEAVILLEVEAERIRRLVPDDYEVGTVGGERVVTAFVAGLSCERLEVGGRPAGAWNASGFGVQVRPPDRSFFNNYWLWSPTTNAQLAAGFAGLGLGERGLLENLTITTRLGDLASSSVVEVPWSYSPYRLDVETAGAFTPPMPRTFTIWRAGTKGNVTIEGEIEDERFQFGTATLTAAPGSPLARILGSERVTRPGFISTFDFEATAGPA